MFGRRKVAAVVAEFLGTGVLTILILSLQRSQYGLAFFVAILGGATLAIMTYALRHASGAMFNPAITLALWTARKVSTVNAVVFIAVQMLAAWAAYGLYHYFVGTSVPSIGGDFKWRVFAIEAVSTGIFAFGYAAAYYQRQRLVATNNESNGAAITGVSYMVGLMLASVGTVGLLNPALALGDRAFVLGTYVLGPIVGAIVGFNLYALLFANLEEEVAADTARVNPATATVTPAAAVVASTKAKAASTKTSAKSSATAKKTTAVAKKPAAKRKTAPKK